MKKRTPNSLTLCKQLHDALLDCQEVVIFPVSESYRMSLDEKIFDALLDTDVVEISDAVADAEHWQRFKRQHLPALSVHTVLAEALIQ